MILAAALDFRQGFQEGEAIGLGKPLQCLLLGLKAQARTPCLAAKALGLHSLPSKTKISRITTTRPSPPPP